MKVAIVVDYLTSFGGGERVLEALLGVYPEATVFTSLFEPERFPAESSISQAKVVTSRLNSFPLTHLISKQLTFLFPFIFSRFDLSPFDLIISVGTIWSKGVNFDPSHQRHIFYCLTPPRFLYGYPSETSKRNVWYYKPFTTLIDHWLRIWDFNTAQKPGEIIVISHEVKSRVQKFYRRDSKIIYPPVRSTFNAERSMFSAKAESVSGEKIQIDEVERRTSNVERSEAYFLIVSRLAAYKGIETAIEACNRLKLSLKIVGVGKDERRLKRLSKSDLDLVEFLGFRSDDELAGLYTQCRAVIFPTVNEDYGLVPLEANSFGKPVIGHRSGGILETQIEGQTAVFYNEDNPASLIGALRSFEGRSFSGEECKKNSQRFSQANFRKSWDSLFKI